MRWDMLLVLNSAWPVGAYDDLILATLQCVFIDASPMEVRRELEYLDDRGLVKLVREPSGRLRPRHRAPGEILELIRRMSRNNLIKFIKTGQKHLGWDDATYRAWLAKHVGKRSCTECNEEELIRLAEELRACGFKPDPETAPPGGSAPDRPSNDQWRYLYKLARKVGFTGLKDPGLATLCRKVAKVEAVRFLDKQGVRSLILALQGWIESRRKKCHE
jgi:phage gp16-like protein